MRIAELSRLSGVPVPTIKYYLRESLVPAGERTSPNQAQYGDSHLRRLRLIRALVEVGGLSIAETREVLASIDSPGKTLHETMGKVQHSVTPSLDRELAPESLAAASRRVEELVRRRGWHTKPGSPTWQLLVQVLATLEELGQDDLASLLDDYADAVETLAEKEVSCVLGRPDVEGVLEGVVIGTVLGDSLLAALRRLAHANASTIASPQAHGRRRTG